MKGLEGSASGMHRALASAPLLSGVFSPHLELILDLGNRAKRETVRQTDGRGACMPGTSRPNTIRSAAPKCARQV